MLAPTVEQLIQESMACIRVCQSTDAGLPWRVLVGGQDESHWRVRESADRRAQKLRYLFSPLLLDVAEKARALPAHGGISEERLAGIRAHTSTSVEAELLAEIDLLRGILVRDLTPDGFIAGYALARAELTSILLRLQWRNGVCPLCGGLRLLGHRSACLIGKFLSR